MRDGRAARFALTTVLALKSRSISNVANLSLAEAIFDSRRRRTVPAAASAKASTALSQSFPPEAAAVGPLAERQKGLKDPHHDADSIVQFLLTHDTHMNCRVAHAEYEVIARRGVGDLRFESSRVL